MPRRAERSKNRRSGIDCTKSDFTVYDYAHASLPSTLQAVKSDRLKKGDNNAWSADVKEFSSGSDAAQKLCDNLSWYDKDLSDFDERSDEEVQEDAAAAAAGNNKTVAVAVPMRAFCSSQTIKHDSDGQVYPVDVWFLIARFLEPEQVGIFASICRVSHSVTHSVQFWQRLYLRHFNPLLPVPQSVTSVERVHGLKSRVVRALHFFYTPYINRSSKLTNLDLPDTPKDLICLKALEGATCVRQWYVKTKHSWSFYWKLLRPGKFSCQLMRKNESLDLMRAPPDVMYNEDAGCVVLQVLSTNFIELPQVTGLVLNKAVTSAGHAVSGMGVAAMSYARGYRLQLIFASHLCQPSNRYRYNNLHLMGDSMVAVIDPALQLDVLHWWHPSYPG